MNVAEGSDRASIPRSELTVTVEQLASGMCYLPLLRRSSCSDPKTLIARSPKDVLDHDDALDAGFKAIDMVCGCQIVHGSCGDADGAGPLTQSNA